MKLALFAALSLVAAPAFAQTAAPAPTTAPTATAKFTLDTPIETIVADPAGKAALDAAVPGITTHPAYEQFKGMSLTQLQPMAGGKLTDEQMAKAKADLAALK